MADAVVNVNVSGNSPETLEFNLDSPVDGVVIISPHEIVFSPPSGKFPYEYQVTFNLVTEGVTYYTPALEFGMIGVLPGTDTSVEIINIDNIPSNGEPEIINFNMNLVVSGNVVTIPDPTIVNNPCGG